jgi:hypothetical protein
VVEFTSLIRLTHGKERQYLLNMRLGGPHTGYGHFVEKKNVLLLEGNELRMVQPIVYSLYLLSYTGCAQ